jgi:exodeoxyribonuclease-5
LAAAQSGRTEAGAALWKRLAYVAITRAEERLVWVTRYALARPAAPLGTDDLPAPAPALALAAEG